MGVANTSFVVAMDLPGSPLEPTLVVRVDIGRCYSIHLLPSYLE